jgi:uncharacterized protein (TIGR03437 family)
VTKPGLKPYTEPLRQLLTLLPATLLTAAALIAQPYINTKGVVNTASVMAPDLPGGAIAQGSVFTILGTGLGPAAPVQTASVPLNISLSGVSVRVFQGATNVSALPLYVSATQIFAVMPSNAPLGRVSVRVAYFGGVSNPAPFNVVASSFGAFTWNAINLSAPKTKGIFSGGSLGSGPAYAQNVNSDYDISSGVLISALQPAMPNQPVTLWGTGLGPNPGPDNTAPYQGDLPGVVEVWVGGQVAEVDQNRRSVYPGVDLVSFLVPAGAPLGCNVPVQVRTQGAIVSNTVTIAISADRSPCVDTFNPLSAILQAGGNMAELFGIRTIGTIDIGLPAPLTFSQDVFAALMRTEPGGPWAFNPLVSLAPPGSCSVYNTTQTLPSSYFPGFTAPGASLDAGAQLSIGAVNAARSPDDPRFYAAGTPATLSPPLQYTISAPGGADVGAFSATLPFGPPPLWTNQTQLQTITRASGVTLTWAPDGSSNQILLAGQSTDVPTDSTALFICIANQGDGQFTVPDYILSSLPLTVPQAAPNVGLLFVGEYSIGNTISTGNPTFFTLSLSVSGKSVSYQ